MTETNINALCSVEAVFDGVDIEVTVEFSAGGGTFKHDELTAESRAKTNQHPIPSITGLQSALDGKSNVGHGHSISDIAGLTILDAPEFADELLTPLAVEATYTSTVWTYLVELFTTVPKSVKEHIVKGWTVIQDLSSRVTALESDIRDFSLTVTQDVAHVELANLNIPKGAVIHLTADWVYTADVPSSAYRLEFNDVVSGYMNTAVNTTTHINLYGSLSEDGQTQAVIYFADTITAMIMNIRKVIGTSPTIVNLMGSRPDFPDSVINTIRIRTSESGKVIAADTKINVKVIK